MLSISFILCSVLLQGEVEDIDLTVKELRSQYLDTVAKIKGKT